MTAQSPPRSRKTRLVLLAGVIILAGFLQALSQASFEARHPTRRIESLLYIPKGDT